jgi:PAS domain S-box-containing protein
VSDAGDSGRRFTPNSADGDRLTVGLDSVPDAVLVADAESRRIVRVNTAAEEMFGRDAADLVGRRQTALHPADETETYVEAFQRGLDNQRVNRLESGEPLFVETADNGRVPVEINVRQITSDGDNYLMGVFREASEQLARERALEQTTNRLETLLDVLPVPVTVLDTDGVVERWNQAAERVLGYTAAEVVGQRYSLFTDAEEFASLLDRVADGETFRDHRTTLRASDGSRVAVGINVRPIYEGDTVSGIVGTAVDLSDRHQREQQLDILHRMARHNFRNELSVIRGWAEALEGGVVGDETDRSDSGPREATEKITAASDRLLKLSEEVVNIGNAVSGRDQGTAPREVRALVSTLSEQLQTNESVADIEVTNRSVSGQVRTKAVDAASRLFDNLLGRSEDVKIHMETDSADNYTELRLTGDTPLFGEGERTLIQRGTETALRHASGLEIARAYLTIQSLGGSVELDCGASGVPAARLRVELPRVDT